MKFGPWEKTFKPVHIVRLIESEVGPIGGEGAATSGLYALPFQLSADAPHEWARLFEKLWAEELDDGAPDGVAGPAVPQAAARHDRIVLTGTTVEEVRDGLKDRLVRVVDLTNREFAGEITRTRSAEAQGKADDKSHRKNVKRVGDEIEF